MSNTPLDRETVERLLTNVTYQGPKVCGYW